MTVVGMQQALVSARRYPRAEEMRDEPRPHIPARPFVKIDPIWIRRDLALDSARRVSTHWDRTPLDGTGITFYNGKYGPNGCEFLTVLGPGIEGDDKHRVRITRGERTGEVVEVGNVTYCEYKSLVISNPNNPWCEPVPDDEPLRGPAVSSNFPMTVADARRIYGEKHPKEDAATVKLGKIVAYFEGIEGGKSVETLKV